MNRIASISVDLDGLSHYLSIHGLGSGEDQGEIYRVAVPRFLALFERLRIRATFFAIGADLASPDAAEALREAASRGHEIANHSLRHRYDLVRCTDAELEAEITGGDAAIRSTVGSECVGFRAPGYNIDERVLATCRALGYRYDSSVFPSVPYYLAKGTVMAALRVRGRASGATLGHPKVLACPTTPYLPDPLDYRKEGGGSLLELPISLVPFVRFPFIGTWVCIWPESVFDAAYAAVSRASFLNLELHAIELMGLVEDGLPSALARQPDLRVSLRAKERRLERALARISGDYETLPLAEASLKLV